MIAYCCWTYCVFDIPTDWMIECGYQNVQLEYLDVSALDAMLQRFYASLQTQKGLNYSQASLVGVRAGINRYLRVHSTRQINLTRDKEFMVSNQVLNGLIKALKRTDFARPKVPMTDSDVNKLYSMGLFEEDKPQTLQNKVIFDIISQFGKQCQNSLHKLRKDSFEIKHDNNGRKYITMVSNEATGNKNVIDNEITTETRLYENTGSRCPMKSYLKYISKLNPHCEYLFQRPIEVYSADTWYSNKCLGVNTLRTFMLKLSLSGNLGQRYTNNSIRLLVLSHLHKQGLTSKTRTCRCNVSSLKTLCKSTDEIKYRISKTINNVGYNINQVGVLLYFFFSNCTLI